MFTGGRNIAMKIPPHRFRDTVAFYRDVLGLPIVETTNGDNAPESVVFEFGPSRLWVDKAPGLSQAEVWLEIVTDDAVAASAALDTERVVRRDEIEYLPEGFTGFWVTSPADVIHLVSQEK
jgi:catechol 2,3-dioxygenase-like lactoylglutathione lyase family enzyme